MQGIWWGGVRWDGKREPGDKWLRWEGVGGWREEERGMGEGKGE